MNRNLRCIASRCPQQWLYLFDDGGVVYSETKNRFAGLDVSAMAAYQAFNAGALIEDLRTFEGAPSASSGDELETIYALSHGSFPTENSGVMRLGLDHSTQANPNPSAPKSPNIGSVNSGVEDIDILGIPVLVEYPAGPLEDLCRDPFRNCTASTQPARCHLSALYKEDRWAIYSNSQEVLSLLRDGQLGLGFLHATRSLLYAEAEYDVAFHAAMVADKDRGIMLCAPRESGKSTLAAYLAAQEEFALMTDEPALLHLDTCSVSSLRLPVSLKEGSWAALQHDWPQLADAPIHVRSDGTRIRLLHPPQARLSVAPRCLTHIVFPEYCPSSVTYMEQLSPLRTLSLLNEAGMILGKHLARQTFEAFLRLVYLTPAYLFRYDSLREAGRMIDELAVAEYRVRSLA